jgi:hypothetical protein
MALQWANFLGDPCVATAHRDLEAATEKAVLLHPQPLPVGGTAFWVAWHEAIEIFVEPTSPLVSHCLVHELIHAILMEEGYWRLTWNQPSKVRGSLSNELIHCEVFRRMRAYGLDMAPYWRYWEALVNKAVVDMTGKNAEQQHYNFLQVFTWFFFPEASAAALAEFQRYDPVLFEAARTGFEEVSIIGTATAEANTQFLQVFKRHWRDYCVEHMPIGDLRTTVVDAIDLSHFEQVRERVEKRTKEWVYDYLRHSKLLPHH